MSDIKDWMKEFEKKQETLRRLNKLYLELIDAPLYEEVSLYADFEDARNLRQHELKHDMYCPACGEGSTFSAFVSDDDVERNKRQVAEEAQNLLKPANNKLRGTWHDRFSLQMTCARKGHVVEFRFVSEVEYHKVNEGETRSTFFWKVRKIGQYPSITDFHRADVARLKEGMSKENQRDFVRAINTAAHGFNVAACVYYRRVFERILDETAHAMALEQGVSNGKLPGYEGEDTAGKIKMLRSELPDFLAENSHLYTLLSKGIHQLTEEECGAEMPLIRQCIELILEDQVEKVNQRKRRERTAQMLAQASQRYAGN